MGVQGTEWGTTENGLTQKERKVWSTVLRNQNKTTADIAAIFGVTSRTVFQHLAKLRDTGLVTTRRIGNTYHWRVPVEAYLAEKWADLAKAEDHKRKLPRKAETNHDNPEVAKRRAHIRDYIIRNPGLRYTVVASALGFNRNTVSNDLGQLRGRGKVHTRGGRYYPGPGLER